MAGENLLVCCCNAEPEPAEDCPPCTNCGAKQYEVVFSSLAWVSECLLDQTNYSYEMNGSFVVELIPGFCADDGLVVSQSITLTENGSPIAGTIARWTTQAPILSCIGEGPGAYFSMRFRVQSNESQCGSAVPFGVGLLGFRRKVFVGDVCPTPGEYENFTDQSMFGTYISGTVTVNEL